METVTVPFRDDLLPQTDKTESGLDKETGDKVAFITFIVPYFAETYKMNMQAAFFYLKKYGGWDYLNNCWWALHIDSAEYAVRDIYGYCRQNGGLR